MTECIDYQFQAIIIPFVLDCLAVFFPCNYLLKIMLNFSHHPSTLARFFVLRVIYNLVYKLQYASTLKTNSQRCNETCTQPNSLGSNLKRISKDLARVWSNSSLSFLLFSMAIELLCARCLMSSTRSDYDALRKASSTSKIQSSRFCSSRHLPRVVCAAISLSLSRKATIWPRYDCCCLCLPFDTLTFCSCRSSQSELKAPMW